MSWELALEYIKALIWPVIVLTLGLTFKKQVGGLIGRLQSVETPVGSANFGEKADAVGQVAAEIGDEISSQLATVEIEERGESETPDGDSSAGSHREPLDADSGIEVRIQPLVSRVGSDPTSTVLHSWRAVEQAMAESLRHDGSTYVPITQLINRVANQGLLSSQLMALVHDLFELRNQVVHGGSVITPAEAESYQTAASRVIEALQLAESPIYRSMNYEDRVYRALRALVGSSVERGGGGAGHDFRVTLNGGKVVVIETKYRTRRAISASEADGIVRIAREGARRALKKDAPVLVITNKAFRPDVVEFNTVHSVETPSAEVIQWNGREEDDYLFRALARATG
ncbi:hypothetical protein ACFVY4_31580 [Streptomyces sp. NPDC058299]|uniref:hypothetical protein n=1 Tax=Streptomyces sp. NPDC058299 TaxID=3346435 RepID=UPI0036EE9EE5